MLLRSRLRMQSSAPAAPWLPPEGYEARRLVLEGLLELRASLNGGDLTISGKLPFLAAEVKKNCEDRLGAIGDELSFGHVLESPSRAR